MSNPVMGWVDGRLPIDPEELTRRFGELEQRISELEKQVTALVRLHQSAIGGDHVQF